MTPQPYIFPRKSPIQCCHVAIALIVTIGFVIPAQIRAQQAESIGVAQINQIGDVLANWTLDQHLFVKGDVGASQAQLEELELWLDEHGSHWTVVLMNNAKGESFIAPNGQQFRDLDAVEFALAHRLTHQTDFGELVNPKTGESSGAVFVLYLSEKEFAYYSTDVYDRRGLGQSQWVGNLDREVIRAMRSGNRIIDAVRNTVSMIEGRLEKQIQNEILDGKWSNERVKVERTREIENLKSLVSETQTSLLPRIEQSASEVRTKHPTAKSALAQPPIEKWRADLSTLLQEAENPVVLNDLKRSKEFQDAKAGVKNIRLEINRYLDAYADHRSFDDMIGPIEAKLHQISDYATGAAKQSIDEASRLLDESRRGHEKGEFGFAASVEKAQASIEAGEQAIESEQARIKQAADRKWLVRRTLMIVAICLGVLFLILLWILNARRRSALQRAHELFSARSETVENEFSETARLSTQFDEAVGTRENLAEQKFRGQTMQLVKTVHQRILNSKDMVNEAKRVIEKCNEFLHPSNVFAKAANMVTGSRFESCINELHGKTLQVPQIVDDKIVDDNGEVSEPVGMTFDEFFSELRQRNQVTAASVKTLGDSVSNVHSRVDELQSKINQVTELEKSLSRASRTDQYFTVPALFESLLPSAQADCDRASSNAALDPVQAISDDLPPGLQKISDGLSVANTIQTARESLFPLIEEKGEQLKEFGFDNRWITESVEDLSDRSSEIIASAVEQSVADEATQFDGDVTSLGQRIGQIHELAEEILNVVEPGLVGLRQKITDARKNIADQLGIDQTKALHEDRYDPDVEVAQVKEQVQSARAAINYGGVESVIESLDVVSIESAQAEHLVASSQAALNEFESIFAARKATLSQLEDRLPSHQASVVSIKLRFADSAMVLRDHALMGGSMSELKSGDELPTIESLLTTCQQSLENSQAAIEASNSKHFDGKILESANSLDLVEHDLTGVDEIFDEIDDHCQRIDLLVTENSEQLANRISEIKALAREVEDDRTQPPTLTLNNDLTRSIDQLRNDFDRGGNERDPFDDSIMLAGFESQISDLKAALESDRRAHDEAARAVGGAEAELATANQLVARSLNDRIPDSRMISQCQDEVARLENELFDVKQRLRIPHETWKTVDGNATRLNSQLGVISGRIRRELELAQQAVQVLTQAADAVFEAANWRGTYGIAVRGNPGSMELERARRKLNQGDYAHAIDFSRSAQSAARNAIDQAARQVDRHRRKLAREAAEARRRRESRSSSRSGIGSSSRSRSSSSRSSTTRSTTRSSSTRRSSGFSRSKW